VNYLFFKHFIANNKQRAFKGLKRARNSVVATQQSQRINNQAQPLNLRTFFEMHATKNELTKSMDTAEMTMYEEVWGEMHVEYDVFRERFDITPLLKGLPNNRDQCPHWGIIVKGQVTIKHDGTEEVAKAGEVYYAPPNHTGIFEAGTELWEFSPMDKLKQTMDAISRNMEAMQKKVVER
jgi:mannose-6-phosphate isomerase-like protein (cupin superfamily)